MQMAPPLRQDMDGIPVIDVSPFIHQTTGGDSVVKAIEAACRETGFFLITGHGVSTEATAQLYSLARDFFDEPQDWKKKQGRGTSLKGASLSPRSQTKR
ncbi:2-oxoglutarate and iron-dependent oxygenase domain-containing protein [Rhizobium sp. RCAM05973]|uniref:2-oxoglutarate and iron-dependent oxygenase domain-containing protein n=1 Tax=Rhizobium sp. RCAM05973 TaxID=2994066 RepID=UPI0022EBB8FB|nr:2-oxoglutarate and iron-dependent oxygenase domain-containing protein [Rhizobium sp. RCAM05973]